MATKVKRYVSHRMAAAIANLSAAVQAYCFGLRQSTHCCGEVALTHRCCVCCCLLVLQLPYEQLRLLLEQRSSEVEVLRNRMEQREASLEALKKNYESQVGLAPCVVLCSLSPAHCKCPRRAVLGNCGHCQGGVLCSQNSSAAMFWRREHLASDAGLCLWVLGWVLVCVVQARRQDAEVQRLTVSLSAAPKDDGNRPGSKAALQRLASEVCACCGSGVLFVGRPYAWEESKRARDMTAQPHTTWRSSIWSHCCARADAGRVVCSPLHACTHGCTTLAACAGQGQRREAEAAAGCHQGSGGEAGPAAQGQGGHVSSGQS